MYSLQSELLKHKSLNIVIKSIYGLNSYYVSIILKKLGFSKNLKSIDLKNDQILELVTLIELVPILKSDSLKRYKFSIFQKLTEIKSVKYKRLLNGLPIRGQRTHTNSKTAKKKLFILESKN